MISKNIYFAIIPLFILLSCSGCKDQVNLEEQAYVSVIGIDKGTHENLSITYQITNATYGSGPSPNRDETMTFEAPDLISSIDLANVVIAKRINLSHAKVLIVGSEYAKNPDFFHQLEAALRYKEYRRGMDIVVSKEKASEFLHSNYPILEDRTSKYYDFMSDRWKETGILPSSDLNRFMQRTEEDEGLFLGAYTSTKRTPTEDIDNMTNNLPGGVEIKAQDNAQMIGAVVFKKGKMIGTITGDENKTCMLLRPGHETNSMFYALEDPLDNKHKVSVRVLKFKNDKYKISTKGEYPKIKVTVPLSVKILAIPSFKDYVEDPLNQQILKKSIQKQLEKKAMLLVKRTQKEFQGDIFLWQYKVRKNFWTYNEYKKYSWMKKYPNAEISVDIDIAITGFGKQLKPPDEIKN